MYDDLMGEADKNYRGSRKLNSMKRAYAKTLGAPL